MLHYWSQSNHQLFKAMGYSMENYPILCCPIKLFVIRILDDNQFPENNNQYFICSKQHLIPLMKEAFNKDQSKNGVFTLTLDNNKFSNLKPSKQLVNNIVNFDITDEDILNYHKISNHIIDNPSELIKSITILITPAVNKFYQDELRNLKELTKNFNLPLLNFLTSNKK
jgi:hypothetical protein